MVVPSTVLSSLTKLLIGSACKTCDSGFLVDLIHGGLYSIHLKSNGSSGKPLIYLREGSSGLPVTFLHYPIPSNLFPPHNTDFYSSLQP